MKSGSKYQPLLEYLTRLDDVEVVLTFTEIETIMGEPLPESARQKRAWWSNRSKGALQAKAWMNAGYLVEDLDFEAGQVVFRKPSTRYSVEYDGDTIKWNNELIRGLRRHMGLSQTDFADKIGVRQQTVSDWETSAYDPRRSMSKFLTIVAEQVGFKYGDEDEQNE
jgi:DNA-binding XRE family transcriptional regulator